LQMTYSIYVSLFQPHAEDPVFGGHYKLGEIKNQQDKSKFMKVITDCLQTVRLTKGNTDEVEEFTYLGNRH